MREQEEGQNQQQKRSSAAWLRVSQPRLRLGGLVALLLVTSLVSPLSLDMYTPAIPHMADYFATDEGTVNLTLTGYYLFFATGMLLFGPLSDKYGRKPIMLAGLALYAVGSAACAVAPSVYALVGARVVQALGAGSVSAVGMAIVKDSFEADRREKILSIMQVLFVIGPAVAPGIGTLVLQMADWRMTFWILAVVGTVCLLLTLLLAETLAAAERTADSIATTLAHLGTVARDRGFTAFLVISSLFEIPFMGYIAAGSYIYIDFFAVGEMGYSLFFGAAALVMATGPFVWLLASKRLSVRQFTTVLFALCIALGALLVTAGQTGPLAFCVIFLLFAIAEAAARPYTMNILLEQQAHNAGAASALLNFVRTGIGRIGMGLTALPWTNHAFGIGVLMMAAMAAALIGWIALMRSSIPLARVKNARPTRVL